MWQQLISGWRPAVEILILAVAIYYALMFVRGTRGWPVVIGFGANVALYLVAWWRSKRVSNDYGGSGGFGGIVAFMEVVLYGSCVMVVLVSLAGALLIKSGRGSSAKALLISAAVSIVVVPATIPLFAWLRGG